MVSMFSPTILTLPAYASEGNIENDLAEIG
jgi:hypothetical protein